MYKDVHENDSKQLQERFPWGRQGKEHTEQPVVTTAKC